MSSVLIIGGGGMLGQKLARSFANSGLDPSRVTLCDRVFPQSSAPGVQMRGDFADPTLLQHLIRAKPQRIFHLAAVVSGQAEEEFALGWRVNVDGTRAVLEAIRAAHNGSGGTYVPRFVFTSSLAVFGSPYPDSIPDDFHTAPRSSYGIQKAIGELMVSEFSRKGIVDGISLRLPTIVVRPGAPNKAASSFFSGIIREPLNGEVATLPVPDTVRHWLASPRAATEFLRHAGDLPKEDLVERRVFNLPGVSCTVADQIEALRRFAGQGAVDLIRHNPDPLVQSIVSGWPRAFAPEAATALGFRGDVDFDAIIKAYVDEDMPAAQ